MATRKSSTTPAADDQELQTRLRELRAAVARQRAARSGAAELQAAAAAKPSSSEQKRIDSLIGQLDNLKAAQNSALESAYGGDTQPVGLEPFFRPSELLESSLSPTQEAAASADAISSPDEQELAAFQAILRAAVA